MCEVSQESVANLLWDPKFASFYKGTNAMDQRLPYLHEFVHVQRICMICSMEMVFCLYERYYEKLLI